ncbi:MAG: acyl-CoA dehydrogenase family protein, partial [Gammaproteobacteria bacterium]
MGWDFETDAEFQEQLDWVRDFVRAEVEPLDQVLGHPADVHDARRNALVRPLQAEVRKRRLWACHLGPELGGQGYGQVKLALLNEILGRSLYGPTVFGCQAPDSGNAEILAHYGTPEQKKKYLEPLLANDIVSCFAMTEPQGGADPKVFTTTAVRDGDHWVLNGQKWFASHARYAEFLITMAITDPDAPPYQRMSMFIV